MRRLRVGVLLLTLTGLLSPVLGQVPVIDVPVQSEDGPEPRIAHVRFTGELVFSKVQLELRTRTRGNRRLLGIPGANWWLWLHRFGDSLGGRLGRGIRASGEPPAPLDTVVVAADVQRLRLFYNQEGFRRADIRAEIDSSRGIDKTHVIFRIDPGPPTFIRSVRYEGLDALEAADRAELIDNGLLGESASPQGIRYSEPLLQEEGRRILNFLRNTGYAFITRDSIHALVTPARPDSFDIVMDVRLGRRYRFGGLSYSILGPQNDVPARVDTVTIRGAEPIAIPGRVEGDGRVDPRLLRRTLQFRPGDWYDQSLVAATKRRLDAVGVFAFTEIRPLQTDSAGGPVGAAPRIPHQFDLRTRDRHRAQVETFMLQRSGGLADSDNEIGMGLGISYSNLNLFGGGESFRLGSTGTIAADLGLQDGFTSTQWDVSATLSWPNLTWPFGGLDRRLGLYDARTRLSTSFLAARRDALRLVLRGRGNMRFQLELQHSPTLTSFIDILDLSVSNPDTLGGFGEIFLEDVLGSIDDPVQQGQIVEDYTQPQINNALRYTLRSGLVDPFRRDDGRSYEASVEFGGNLPYLLDRFVFGPGEVEQSLPGLPFFGGSNRDDRLIYRQYLRGTIDLRRYNLRAPGVVTAWKAIIGVAQPVGAADVVPFDRRFYSGGAASVRAWRLRELGPGSASFSDSVGVGGTSILGGEIKLEGSVEHRRVFLRGLFEADWSLALFVDAGNVWSGPRNPGPEAGRFRFDRFYREIGVGSGFGIRLGWEYLIVRLDLALKVHDPLRRGEIMPDGFSSFVPQFGIGHTF